MDTYSFIAGVGIGLMLGSLLTVIATRLLFSMIVADIQILREGVNTLLTRVPENSIPPSTNRRDRTMLD